MFRVKGDDGKALLNGVIAWVQRSKIPEMAKFAMTLVAPVPLSVAPISPSSRTPSPTAPPRAGRGPELPGQRSDHPRTRVRCAAALMNMASLVHGSLCPD